MDLNYKEIVKEMMAQMEGGATYKAVSATPSATMGHGPGGLFNSPGLSRPVFSAMVLPRLGIQAMLPIRPANDFNPLHGIMTGVTSSSGSEPTGVCDDPPMSGLMKLCTHSFVFGRLSRQTKVFDLDTFGRITNRGEFTDLQLFGNPFANEANPNVPTMPGASGAANALNNEIAKALFELGVSWARDFAQLLYTGSPANNTAGGGYKEFYGFQTLVNTGYRDAENGQVCPAADSLVMTFNKQTTGNEREFVRDMTYIFRNLNYIAARTGLAPVTWVISMPFSLFYEVTEFWPCAYLSYRCVTSAVPSGSTAQNFIDAASQNQMRDAMRADLYNRVGQYLLIDGQRVPVVIDDANPETVLPGGAGFYADVYFIPMTVLGNIPVTYLEYFNYDSPSGAMEAAQILSPNGSFYTTDNGRFMWHRKPPTNFCVQLLAKMEPRLIFETPYLAGRLTNVQYAPLLHERTPFPNTGASYVGASYYVDGGRSGAAQYGPSYWSPTGR